MLFAGVFDFSLDEMSGRTANQKHNLSRIGTVVPIRDGYRHRLINSSVAENWRMNQFNRIAIHNPPGIAIWEDILKGVFQFARPDLPWIVAANFGTDLDCLKSWSADGVIAQCTCPEEEEFFRSLNIPVVNVARERSEIAFPSVQIDDHAVGEMAANYFCDRGFQNFACYTLRDREFMTARVAGFVSQIEARQGEVSLFEASDFSNRQNFEPPNESLQNWLTDLPRHTAIFATTDALGVVILSACRFLNRKVPVHLSILGASNNELLCNLEYPSLSSIRLPGQRLGFEAASRLHSMLRGKSEAPDAIRLPPVEIVNRQSSDIYCIDDESVAQALKHIRDHFNTPINVAAVVAATGVSRSGLERRFRKLLGRSILDELVAHRVRSAKRLLVTTRLPLSTIATQTGFTNARQFSTTFKKQTGEQPSFFRERMTSGDSPPF